MKICNLDLNDGWNENVTNCPKYGGGNAISRAALDLLNDKDFPHNEFWIYAGDSAFVTDQPWDDKGRCVSITEEDKAKLRSGEPVKNIIKNAERFEIFLHNYHNISLNLEGLEGVEVCWLVGTQEAPNPKIKHILLYSAKYQAPIIQNPDTKTYPIQIGRKIPKFAPRDKGNYIVAIHRHWKQFRSIEIAEYCKANKINCFMAGPISNGYELLNHVDGKYVKYLGEIGEDIKHELFQSARLALFISDWPNPFSLGAIEANANGCGIVCKNHGFWPSYVKDGLNGFMVQSEHEIKSCYENSAYLNQLTMWQAANQFNDIRMVRSVTDALHEVLKNSRRI